MHCCCNPAVQLVYEPVVGAIDFKIGPFLYHHYKLRHVVFACRFACVIAVLRLAAGFA